MCCAIVDDSCRKDESKSGGREMTRNANLLVITKSGCLLRFEIDASKGGECTLLEEALLFPKGGVEERRRISSEIY